MMHQYTKLHTHRRKAKTWKWSNYFKRTEIGTYSKRSRWTN